MQFSDKNPIKGVIVFSQDAFKEPYTKLERSYEFTSDNKHFISRMYGNSIFAHSLDGKDHIRLDNYIGSWPIEECYIKNPEVLENTMNNQISKYIVIHDHLSKEEREELHLSDIKTKTEVKASSKEEAIEKVIKFHQSIEKEIPIRKRVFPLTNKENIISCEIKNPNKDYGLTYKIPDDFQLDKDGNEEEIDL